MTRCSSENLYPLEGLGWTPPDPLPVVLETDRLIIRPYKGEDAPELHRVVEASRDHLIPWLPWCRTGYLDPEASLHDVMNQIMELRDLKTLTRVILGVFLRETGELVGGSGIHDIRRDTASCETGYWASSAHLRKGYIEEACRRTISWALTSQDAGGLGFNRVRIYTSDQNIASAKLVEKLGIAAEVHQRADYYVEPYGCTTRLGWGVLADEWDCDRHRVKQ